MIGVKFIHVADYSLFASRVCTDVNDGRMWFSPGCILPAMDGEILPNYAEEAFDTAPALESLGIVC